MNIPRLTLRKIETSDFSNLLKFLNTVSDSFVPALSKNEIKTYVNELSNEKFYGVIIENEKSEIQAAIQFKEHYKGKDTAYIEWIAIDPKHRKEGEATILFTEIINILKADSIKHIKLTTWSTNFPALSLYKKMGFVEIKKIKNDRGKGINTVRLEKTIS